ncbi:MAG: endonuclease domain-containing protein, partial [Caulobacterales bacterium]
LCSDLATQPGTGSGSNSPETDVEGRLPATQVTNRMLYSGEKGLSFPMSLDPSASLMAAHNRLRSNGFPIVSVISARTALDARVWLGQWCRNNDRALIVAPVTKVAEIMPSYSARIGGGAGDIASNRLPMLLLPHSLREALAAAVELLAQHNTLPVAITCGLAEIVDGLLDSAMPLHLVSLALEGLIPSADAERQVLKVVAEGRQVRSFLRGACEGLVYFMLEARSETRGLFEANGRLPNSAGGGTHEVDIVSEPVKLVIEIDGAEHDQPKRKAMDTRKHADLESQGYMVRRFSNQQVIDDPVGVWKLIYEQVAHRS